MIYKKIKIVTGLLCCVCVYLSIYFREGEGGRKRERNINMQLTLTCPLLGTWPTTWACALTGNRTRDHLVCRLALNPLSHTSQGYFLF